MWLAPSLVVARIVATSLLLAHPSTAVASVPDSLSSYLAAHPISTQTATPLGLTNAALQSNLSSEVIPPSIVNSVTSRCPASCDDSSLNPNNWTVYHDVNRLSWCNQTMLLNFAIYNSLDDPNTHLTIRSCAASFDANASAVSNATSDTLCLSKGSQTQVQKSLQIAFNESDTSGSVDDFVAASQQMASFLAQQEPNCNDTIAFTYSGSAAIGIFAGSHIQSQGISTSVLQQFITQVESNGISESVLVQLCAGSNQTQSSRYSLGIIANANADVGFVQNAVATWASGGCVTTYDNANKWQNITLSVSSPTQANSTSSNGTYAATQVARALSPRSTCSTVQVVSGDTCKYSQIT